ncbi:hypothetical protein L1049_004665 [Liquidambar formosana]|uniref:BHLH domain-containing protein n=1 Tax=Liquidambar formosana TaxID=63359 RepID=A0AAP0RPM0_LIQFO
MEEQSDHENPVQLMSLTFGGSSHDVPLVPEDDPSQHYIMAAGRNENHHNALPFPQWMYCPQTAHNYVEFLAESSTLVHKAATSYTPEGNALPADSIHAVNGVSEIQSIHNNLGKTCDFKYADYSLNMDPCKERHLRPHNEGEPVCKFTSAQIRAQNHTSWPQESNEDSSNVFQLHSREPVAAPSFLSKPRKTISVSRQRSTTADRRRRLRIAERLKALQELLPYPEEGFKASVLDDVIDHVKYLQLQLKDLSQSRLGGESSSNPFVFLEGYGHYLFHEQMMNEPLEEMMGKLLEVNPSAAAQLLASRGLSIMPMALTEGLLQVI